MPRSSSKKQPEPIALFLDRSLGRHVFPHLLRDRGLAIQVHDEVFAQDTPDEVWITHAASHGFLAVTRDKRIGRTPTHLHAVFASGVRLIIVAGGEIPTEALARNFVNAYPAIVKFAAKHRAPFIAKLARPNHRVVLDQGEHSELRMYKSSDELHARFDIR